jgi:hypothetical protein
MSQKRKPGLSQKRKSPRGRDSNIESDFFPDVSVSNPDSDELNFLPFATQLAATIASRKDPLPLIFGIYGEWGSGKTTVLNFLKGGLDKHKDVICFHFNPWLFSDQNLSMELTKHILPPVRPKWQKTTAVWGRHTRSVKGGQLSNLGGARRGPNVTRRGVFFYVDRKATQQLAGQLVISKPPSGEGRSHDKIDICVIKIQGPVLPPFEDVNKFPLSTDLLLPHAMPRAKKQYLLVGFPSSRSKPNQQKRIISSHPYSFRNLGAEECKYSTLRVDPRSHILVAFSKEQTMGSDGLPFVFPSPKGMSGSPVWLLHDAEHPGKVDLLRSPLVGIAIEENPQEEVIVATDIAFAMQCISNFEADPSQ